MAPGPSHRPQKLKQAKNAYRKSSATVRLSDSELALIERRAVLQERADRIREREARRKANLKKKEERNEKEREMRQRMNLPSPTKGGFHVRPSQLTLGDFMVMGGKRKREEAPSVCEKVGDFGPVHTEFKTCQASTRSPPSRTPLQEASGNTMIKVEPHKKIHSPEQLEQDNEYPQQIPTTLLPSKHSRDSPQVPSTKPTTRPIPLAKPGAPKVERDDKKAITSNEASPMGPPPLPNPMKAKFPPSTPHQSRALLAPQCNPPTIPPDPWDDIFVSNTQIVREISLPPLLQTPKPGTPIKIPSPSPLPIKNETPSLLSNLNSPDLNTSNVILAQSFTHPSSAADTTEIATLQNTTLPTTTISSLLLQISTQDLDFSSPSPSLSHPSQSQHSSEYNDDVTEEDLEDLVLEYEMQSSWRPTKGETTKGESMMPAPEVERGGEGDGNGRGVREKAYDDEDKEEAFDLELSTQDWRELGRACECT